ncbi:MAG TPA: hypothetical protein VGF75_05180, partial [Candidatus Saccharimonadales bacterium]
SAKSLLAEYANESQKVEQTLNKYKSFIYVLQLLKSIDGPISDKYRRDQNKHLDSKLYKLHKAAKERYEMLDMVSPHQHDEFVKVIKYVNLVDENVEKSVTVVKAED